MASAPLLALGAWLLTYLVHSTMLFGAVALMRVVAPRRTLPFAETAWRVALFGGIGTATVQLVLASLGSHLPGFASVVAGTPTVLAGRGMRWLAHTSDAARLETFTPFIGPAVVVWLLIAAIRLLALVRAHRAFSRMLADRTPLGGATAREVHARCSEARGSRARLSVSPRIATPLVIGGGEVCLPARAVETFTLAELDAALAHEVAHLVRRDSIWLTLSAVVERVLFVQPLTRVAHDRLRVLAECACDDWALARTQDPLALASALTHVTGWLAGNRLHALAIGMSSHRVDRESLAVARVRRILDPAETRLGIGPGPAQLSFAATALAAVVLLVPHVAPRALQHGNRTTAAHARNTRYTISAHDDAGPFTLTLEGRDVVGMTIDGEQVAASRIRRIGARVVVAGTDGNDALDVTLTGPGGISWNSRSASSTALAR